MTHPTNNKLKQTHIPGTQVLCVTNPSNNLTYHDGDIEALVRSGCGLGLIGRSIVKVQIREGNSAIIEIVHKEFSMKPISKEAHEEALKTVERYNDLSRLLDNPLSITLKVAGLLDENEKLKEELGRLKT